MPELAEKIRTAVRKDIEQQKAYYDYLKAEREPLFNSLATEAEINNRMLVVLEAVERQYAPQLHQKTGVEGPNPIINTPAQAADSAN